MIIWSPIIGKELTITAASKYHISGTNIWKNCFQSNFVLEPPPPSSLTRRECLTLGAQRAVLGCNLNVISPYPTGRERAYFIHCPCLGDHFNLMLFRKVPVFCIQEGWIFSEDSGTWCRNLQLKKEFFLELFEIFSSKTSKLVLKSLKCVYKNWAVQYTIFASAMVCNNNSYSTHNNCHSIPVRLVLSL